MRRYRVIGPRPIFETPPGGVFVRHLAPGAEAALLGLHLEIVQPEPPEPPKRQPPAKRTRKPRPPAKRRTPRPPAKRR